MPPRELNVKVWDEEQTRNLTSPESGEDAVSADLHLVDDLPTSPLLIVSSPKMSTPSQNHSSLHGIKVDEEDVAEELPTNPYMAVLPQNVPINRASSLPGIDSHDGIMSHDQFEDIDTRPYAVQLRPLSQEIEKPVQVQHKQAIQTPPGSMNSPAMQQPVTPVPISLSQSQFPPAQPLRQTPPGSMPVPPVARSKKNKRKRLAIVFGLLFILLLGGVIAWAILAQPFTVPEITKTTQNFTDPSLGVSLQYPQKWAFAVNKQNGTVSFYDDNHTDQMDITIVAAGNQNMKLYVSKFASLIGITGQRTLPEVLFAGATWQQIQGNVQQSGANYKATLLVTMHGGYYYTIIQLAPASTYPLEEQLVFSKMRSSFQF